MEKGCKVIIVNPDSSFFGKKGRLVEIKPTKEVVFLRIDLGSKTATFTSHESGR
jgi:hypothetical protein